MAEVAVILASASPRRRELLASLIADFSVVVSGVDEFDDPPLATLAERLARTKCEAVGAGHPAALVVAADTVVTLDGRSIAKPDSADDARAMLQRLAGNWHEVHSGVAVMREGTVASATSTSRVLIHTLDDAAIDAYVASGRPMDKAGAYGIQDDDVPTVDALEGCFCGVMGLPLWLTYRLLRECGAACREPSLERCLRCPNRAR